MAIVEHWTARSGPRIRYLDNAPGDATVLPVLFCPGLSDTADEYVELLDSFRPRRALVLEVRGRGRSEAPSSGYRVADHVRDLQAVLDQEGIDRFHLMTFSRGTSWGLQLAIDQPERVASIAVGDYQAAEVLLTPELLAAQLASRFRGVPMVDRVPPSVLERLASDSVDRPLWDELGHLSCPLLVARAASGGILGDELLMARYRAARPDLEELVLPGHGHDLFRHDRRRYAHAVVEFLARRCTGC